MAKAEVGHAQCHPWNDASGQLSDSIIISLTLRIVAAIRYSDPLESHLGGFIVDLKCCKDTCGSHYNSYN